MYVYIYIYIYIYVAPGGEGSEELRARAFVDGRHGKRLARPRLPVHENRRRAAVVWGLGLGGWD